jgi:CRISPR-associated protein Cmr3
MSQKSFNYLITVSPLGLMYGSAGAFLSPQSLVGRSGSKFPPDAATLSGLFFSINHRENGVIANHKDLAENLYVAGPFWAERSQPEVFYVPIPRTRIIDKDDQDDWTLDKCRKWQRDPTKDLESYYTWQSIDAWARGNDSKEIRRKEAKKVPWKFVSFLHPKMKLDERHVVDEDGLFLENAIQMDEDYCLVYLATYKLPDNWYRFGGENHLVEIESHDLSPDSTINGLLRQEINDACALITPGVWGSVHLSYRYPKHPEFPRQGIKMLTDKAIPYRHRIGHRVSEKSRLGRGRYAVPPGTVYCFKKPLNKTWWQFPSDWFPEKGLLKKMGCGLCLPIQIQGA